MSKVWSANILSNALSKLPKTLGKVLEIGCWVAGGAMLSLYLGARFVGETERETGIEAFAQARTQAQAQAQNPAQNPAENLTQTQDRTSARNPASTVPPNFVTPRPFLWQDFERPAALALAASEPPSVSKELANFPVDGKVITPESTPISLSLPIALLTIARVGLEVPVFSDTSARNLNRGAGWVEGTAAPDDGGNIAIAAHRDGYFRVLKDVEVGDVLVLESITQQTNYLVTEISIVEPGDTSSLLETETAAVTLVTCYPFYFVGHAPQRYIVRAVAL